MFRPIVLFSTCGKKETAEQIAALLVEKHLAACVNVVAGVTSFYHWNGKVHNDSEVLLIIKSISSHLDKIHKLIKTYSGYELPELISFEITGGSNEYLAWLEAETKET